ncbi:MAG: hypothetical protein IRZ16_03865 [Myxococcaceae bacterium]|nr:hypothetical protein [Myxococcaceae bacterium]
MNVGHRFASASHPHTPDHDPVRSAVQRLAALLPQREDASVLVDFLEDDLREGLAAIADVEAHFTDVLDLLRSDHIRPISLLDAGEDLRVLERLEYLMVVVSQLKRRLSQAAGKLRNR